MKAKDGFLMRKVGERRVVVPVGEASESFRGMLNLNETGAFLWNLLSGDTTEEEMLDAMLAEYDTNREEAKKGIEKFLQKLRETGILEE